MKTILRVLFWGSYFLLLVPALVFAQGDCPTIVQEALTATHQVCAATGRNQACYGNVTLNAVPQPGVSDLHFSQPGDLTAVSGIQALTLSSRVLDSGEWGIALMSLQANLPDILPG